MKLIQLFIQIKFMKKSLFFLLLLFACVAMFSVKAKIYTQCGGIGWDGPTICEDGSLCVAHNEYYSQCLPNP